MRKKLCSRFLTVVTTLVLAAVSAGAQELQLHGRVSYDTKGILVKGAADKDWERATINTLLMPGDSLWVDQGGLSEVELSGGTFLRLADGSKAELKALPPAADVRGWMGSFYVQRVSRSQGSLVITTPSCQVDVPIDSCVRVDVDEKGGATVSVRWGGAEVRTEAGAPVRLAEAQRLWVDPGYLPSDPTGFDRAENDSFDQWNGERASVLANGYQTLPKEVEIAAPVVGVSDLGSYGEWVYVDSRPCWRPTVVADYVPYRYGCWNYSPAFGNVWVGAYPFCYVTSHYGRWNYASSYGWCWSYDPVWSPAWATTVCAGDYLMWAPMGYDYRPVMMGTSAYFGIGGVNFCMSSTSWMPMSYVTTGWAPVSPCSPWFADTVCTLPTTQINIWNIYGDGGHHGGGHPGGGDGHDGPRPHPSPFDSNVFHERDYNPPRSIRGMGGPSDGPAPGERAHALETRMGRQSFAPVEHTGGRMERSAAGRSSSMRSVRLDSAAALQPDTAPGLAAMRRGRTTDGAGPHAETRGQSGGRELRTGRDNGAPTLTNETAAAARSGNLTRSNAGLRDSAPTISGEGRTPVSGEARSVRGTPDAIGAANGTENNRALRGAPSAGAERSLPRASASGRASLRDIDPGTPVPGASSRPQSTPEKTPVRGAVRQAPGASSTPYSGSRGDSGMNAKPSSRTSSVPTYAPTRSSRPLSFDTDASRVTAPRTTSPRAETSMPRSQAPSSRMENIPTQQPRYETPQQRSAPVQQPRYEAPQQRSAPVQQPRYEAPAPMQQPRYEAPQQRSAPVQQPRYEAPAPMQQPRYEAPQQRSAPVQQPHYEAPQPRFESPRVSAPSMSSRSFTPDTNSSSGGSSQSRGGVRGR